MRDLDRPGASCGRRPLPANRRIARSSCSSRTEDVEADHEHLLARGVDVDEAIMREGEPVVYWADAPLAGVPATFRFRDPDGNSFLMVQRI
jgi:catechol 2,3-dioxygenase-like lactoylglutathione lyase family enzyme